MADSGWKQFERRIARVLGTSRIPVTGERNGADLETPLLCVQAKKRATVPGYLFEWLDGIREAAQRRGKVGIVVMQRPRAHDLDSLVVLSLRDWIELHGPAEKTSPQVDPGATNADPEGMAVPPDMRLADFTTQLRREADVLGNAGRVAAAVERRRVADELEIFAPESEP